MHLISKCFNFSSKKQCSLIHMQMSLFLQWHNTTLLQTNFQTLQVKKNLAVCHLSCHTQKREIIHTEQNAIDRFLFNKQKKGLYLKCSRSHNDIDIVS